MGEGNLILSCFGVSAYGWVWRGRKGKKQGFVVCSDLRGCSNRAW